MYHCRMTKYFCFFIFLLIFCFKAESQHATIRSRSELGFLLGGTYYIGDLNRFNQVENTKLAGGLIYRFNVNPRLSLRGNFIYGNVKGDDAQSNSELYKNRNLNFSSSILEAAAGIEFNYFPFEIGHNRYKGTAYILAEIGLFKMNPMTRFDSENIELQPLGTEGQGSSLSTRGAYSLTQLCVPLGFGAKLSVGKWAAINFELGLRKTFTDYIDDVHSNTYVDPEILATENGTLSAALSNRSLDRSLHGKRGTASSKDWYVFSGFMVTFKLGKRKGCAFTY